MCQYKENLAKSISAYRSALKACHDVGVWPKSEGVQPRYFHTPKQRLAISKLLNSQANHRFVIQNYAEHVGPVPEHFFAFIHHRGFLMAPGVKQITGVHLLVFVLLLMAMLGTIPYMVKPKLGSDLENQTNGVSKIEALQSGN